MAGQVGLNVFQLAGIRIDLNDPPWWTHGILRWLYCTKSLLEASGDYSAYKHKCKDYLDTKPPKMIYDLFQDYVNRLEHEEVVAASKRKSK